MSQLHPQEIEIIRHLSLGHTAKVVARKMSLSVNTINWHVHNAMKKTEIHTSAGLVAFAIRSGTIQ